VGWIKASPGGFGKLAGRLCDKGFKRFGLEVATRQASGAINSIASKTFGFLGLCPRGAALSSLSPVWKTMAGIHITDIEAAINFWREKKPSPDGITLCAELRALAEVYALMIFYHEAEADEFSFPAQAYAAWKAWYDTTPDTPCIAICSTSQGDAECKGCGRSFEEVQLWPEMSPAAKRATWRRITMLGEAMRFNKYAERAAESRSSAAAAPPVPPSAGR